MLGMICEAHASNTADRSSGPYVLQTVTGKTGFGGERDQHIQGDIKAY